MTKDQIAAFRLDLAEFRDMTQKFYRKEISVPEYKSFSGGFGSYAQRGGTASMLRLRLTGGEITKDTLAMISQCIEKYQISLIHLTTCQSLQFHNLTEAQVLSLIEDAFDHGIITRGGGGDYPRNVMASPLSGVQKGEPFDVLPYAREAADYLLGLIGTVKLPRKLKVCFNSSPDDEVHATFRDLGFVANADQTFDVYAAGGLGRSPRMGVKVASHTRPDKLLAYIQAMVDTFTAYGNYENRGRARTRFMQEDLGAEGFVQAYREKLKYALASANLDLDVTVPVLEKTGSDTHFSHPRVIAQKQPGLYAVCYAPCGGNVAPALLQKLSQALTPMQDVALRITPDQTLYLINCTAEEARTFLALTPDSAGTRFEQSTACIGASICQVGARDSQALLSACLNAVKAEQFADGVLPAIRISGCPSSCSAHPIAALGFRGGVKQTPDGPKPAFAVYEGGSDCLGQEQFGQELGVMAEDEIPAFLVELGRTITADRDVYETWIQKNREKFLDLVKKYI